MAPSKPSVLVFDVNETLLDLSIMRAEFENIFADATAAKEWFALLLQYSVITTVLGDYKDFGVLGTAALEMVAQSRNMTLPAGSGDRILRVMQSLPAHPDVPHSLARLRDAGFKLVALTNSSTSMIRNQLANSGLAQYLEQAISVDAVKKFKPHRAVYEYATQTLNKSAGDLCLVAAHSWDVMGAMNAGWNAAFISRPGKVMFPLAPPPTYVARDLGQLADSLIPD